MRDLSTGTACQAIICLMTIAVNTDRGNVTIISVACINFPTIPVNVCVHRQFPSSY